MAVRQRIVRVRRDYNQWVANQTLEDYALRFTAKSARRWSPLRVANTALGGISFLALEAIGGTVTLGYGFINAIAAIVVVSLLFFLTGLPISYYAARDGVDIDLLTRGAGFGYIGSTVTSLIYASFTFIFFAIEAAILASMLQACFDIPPAWGYLICAVAVVPLVTHGITFISRIQLWSQPVWAVLQVLPFVVLAATASGAYADWTSFSGVTEGGADRFDPVMVGAAGSVIFALIAQIGEQADFLRFLPPQTPLTRRRWWLAMLAGGPGWIVIGIVKLLAGSFLAVLALRAGFDAADAAQPSVMYAVAFERVVHSPTGALALMACFVVVSQLKINITNAYAGSIAWSNFFSRLTHSHPGRVVWVVFNIAIALLLMELGIYQAIEHTLVIYSAVAAAWVGALVADLVVNKPLGLSPPHIEFKRAHLYDINPVGTGAMLLAVIVALLAYAGAFGRTTESFCPFIAFGTAFIVAPLIAWATEGRYYLARKPRQSWARESTIGCVICENAFEPEDMAFCPAYSGAICSLCCSLDARCHDLCKPKARIQSQVVLTLRAWLPSRLHAALTGPLGRWAVMVSGLILIIAIVFAVIDGQMATTMPQGRTAFRTALLTAFAMLVPIAGVLAWLLVLGQQSRRVAQEESQRQTTLLLDEIAAHERTDAALQKAKEAAEAANLAKSRFVVGVSHELRSPLNAILGYAQLMERDTSLSPARRSNVSTMRRSGEHMAGLIEALLDIAKIEAGRIDIYRDAVRLPEFLQQLVQMFQLQAAARGIEFEFSSRGYTPDIVHTDERRLRQILINLLSNAVKFTQSGTVSLRLTWRSEVAEFAIQDTGIGIGAENIERIFEPFVRLDTPVIPTPGVGLGLTITRLLTQIMGGELTVTSTPRQGSTFTVRLHLSAGRGEVKPSPIPSIAAGYTGRRLTVLIADDDPAQRELLHDLLAPLGFALLTATGGDDCLRLARDCRPDLLLVDVNMPGPSGWEVARTLRHEGFDRLVIIVISAHAAELAMPEEAQSHDDVLSKPMDLSILLHKIASLLGIEWTASLAPAAPPPAAPLEPLRPAHADALRELGAIGYVRGIHAELDRIETEAPENRATVARLRQLVSSFEIQSFMQALGVGGE